LKELSCLKLMETPGACRAALERLRLRLAAEEDA